MRHPFATPAIGLLLATLCLSQEAPDPFLMERILPQNALLYISVPQSAAATEGYAKSNVAALWNHPEVRAFTGPIEKWWLKRKNEPTRTGPPWNEIVKGTVGLSIDEVWEILQGPLTFSIYDVPLNEDHRLDLVLSLGSPDVGKLQKAYGAVKQTLKQHGAELQESEFKHQGTTITQLVVDGFPIFYAVVEKTFVFATTQERIEGILSNAADKTAAGLREDAGFKAARATVAADNRHFFLFYLNSSGIVKRFRREIGDEGIRILDTLGLTDLTSIALSLTHDGGPIRERYALMASKQTRGLLKFLAGGTPEDAAAAFVPKGALDYSHFGLNLAEAYDVFLAAAKIDAEFEEGVKQALQEYEKRVGLKIRDALATLGTSWTGYSAMPPGGGLFPDAVYAVSLNDPAAFEAAVAKIVQDAELGVEETTFRGRKLRWVSIPFPLGDLGPLFGGDFLELTYPVAYFIQDKLVFLSTNPMALKRQILRFGEKGPLIAEDAKFQALWSKVPAGQRESWTYIDFGRILNLFYSSVEPFLHLVRDLPRDPETGDLIVDLSRLPLGETLADLFGASFTHKRTTPEGIVIDSYSNTSMASPTGAFGAGIVAAIAIPGLIAARRGGGAANNERIAESTFFLIRQAQETFRNSDSDRNGTADYWTRDVAGLYGLKDASGQIILLLVQDIAQADVDGAARYNLDPQPFNGYLFKALVTDQDGTAYAKDDDKDGQSVTNKTRYGVVAYPAQYGRAGRFTFIMNETGRIYKKDTQGQPVDKWPGKNPKEDGWEPTEE